MKAGLRHKALFAIITIASILFIASSSGAQDGEKAPDDKKTWTVTLPYLDRRFCAGSGMTSIDLPWGIAPGSGARKVLKTEKTSKGTKETYTDGSSIEWEIGPKGEPRVILETLRDGSVRDGSVIDGESSRPKEVEKQTSSATERERSCNEGVLDAFLKTDAAAGTPKVSPEPAKAEETGPSWVPGIFGTGGIIDIIRGGRDGGDRGVSPNPCAGKKR